MDRAVSIVVDHRERESGVPAMLQGTEGVTVTYATLAVGDYLINERLLFERKTLLDFVTSIKDGRLFRQARRLASGEPIGAFILEGVSRSLSSSRMRREAIQGALISLSFIFGIPVLRSLDTEETAKLMLYTARQVRAFSSGAVRRSGLVPKKRRRAQLYLLQGLPGIGVKRAQNLLETFGSVEAVFKAELEELVKVEGIGTVRAEAIRWVARDAATQSFGRP